MINIQSLTMIASVVALAGCGAFGSSLVDQGAVTLKITETSPVSISHASVDRADGDTVLRGETRFPTSVRLGVFSGHVDFDATLPTGETFARRNIEVHRKRIPKQNGRKGYFVTDLGFDPPRGTVLALTYHDGSHKMVNRGIFGAWVQTQ